MLHLLMLMVLLCDVEATCPKDNPLTLVPSEVIAEYGGEFLVNCTSSNDDYDKLLWSNGTEISETDGDESFTTWLMPLLDWNIMAQCIIHINSFVCSKDLKITLYKNPDTVILFPIKYLNYTVAGTQYTLQCDVLNVAPAQNLIVTWYKDKKMISTEFFPKTTKTPVSESSLLSVEVSREDNGAIFECEAQLNFGPNGPKLPPLSDSHIVFVHYAPEFNDNTTYVNVREGDDVTLSCDAEGNPPPRFIWTRDGVDVMENTKNLSVTQVNVNAVYTCTASNELGQKEKLIFINVIKDVMRAPDVAVTTPAAQKDCLLTLMPAEVVVRFGDRASVNCSTSATDVFGMGWEASVGGTGFINTSSVTWTVEELQAWSIKPKCYIILRNQQCFGEPTITVYKNPDTVILFPINYLNYTVAGTQYTLQCDVLDVAPAQNLIVTWYKDKKMISTEFFRHTTKTPVSESSLLSVEVSREDNGAIFECEAQLNFGPNGPKLPPLSDSHIVSVHYAPEFNDNTTYVNVREGDDVTLSCDAEGNPPPRFIWTRDGVDVMENTKNLSVTQVNVNAVYTCTASNELGQKEKLIFINVIKDVMRAPDVAVTTPAAQKDCLLTLMPAEVVVRFGDRASVNCSTSATDVFGMGWEASVGGTGFINTSSVTWTVEELQVWSIKPKCYITVRNQQCIEEPTITVYKTPDVVSISAATQGPMVEGVQYLLRSDVTNVAPVQNLSVVWYMGEKKVNVQTFTDTLVTPVNVSSFWTVTPTRDHNGIVFRCHAELHLGPNGPKAIPIILSKPYTAVVHYKPMVEDCPSSYIGLEHYFSLEMIPCRADGNPPPIVHWYYKGMLINQSEPLYRADSGKYTATFSNELGQTNTSVDVTIGYGPSFTCNHRYVVKENEKIRMECKPEGIPAPNITWYKDEKVIHSQQHWTRHDSGRYELKATNQYGTANHPLYLDVLFAPEFKGGNDTQEVILGENVTFACSAEGNPVPEIQWKFTAENNVRETTGGRQKDVIITGATSNNDGVYICVATNNAGSVSRSVTLKIRDVKGSALRRSITWWLPIFCILLLLIIVFAFCRFQRRHGQYSFIPAAREASDMPLNTMSGGDKA